MKKILVGIIMGSDSDLPVMQDAADILQEFDISFEIKVVSAHRTPDRMYQYAKDAKERGLKVIIAGAGGSAHLPGMVASMTPLPVIGVPVRTKNMDGMDSLLSIVQMPRGIPVATVAINGAQNAGLLAARIIGAFNDTILQKVTEYQQSLEKIVLNKTETLELEGYKKYLERLKK